RQPSLGQLSAWHAGEAWLNETEGGFRPHWFQGDTGRHWFAARFHLDRLMSEGTPDAMLHKRRGRAEVELRDWDNAVSDYTKAIELGLDGDPEVWLGRAWGRHGRGEAEQAAD